MRKLIGFLCILIGIALICMGCNEEFTRRKFQGSIQINRQNGKIISVRLYVPSEVLVETRSIQELDDLLSLYESFLIDLRNIREQLPAKEPQTHKATPGVIQ